MASLTTTPKKGERERERERGRKRCHPAIFGAFTNIIV
jgi:hypothetical protein